MRRASAAGSADATFLQLNFVLSPFSGLGPRHLIDSTPKDLYVLPSAFTLVNRMPPAVTAVTGTSGGTGSPVVGVTGSGFTGATRILFDGEVADTVSVAGDGTSIVVAAPPAPFGYRANVIALNDDGQASLFLAQPVAYTYASGSTASPSFSLSAASQAAGTDPATP
jgi:hypothetical protein